MTLSITSASLDISGYAIVSDYITFIKLNIKCNRLVIKIPQCKINMLFFVI